MESMCQVKNRNQGEEQEQPTWDPKWALRRRTKEVRPARRVLEAPKSAEDHSREGGAAPSRHTVPWEPDPQRV